jgi:hypothetical protein
MNTVERIVESYFRLCRSCFTYSDVKVVDGNNRQMDILAVSMLTSKQYHVECSVTHRERWCPTPEELILGFQQKFSGIPPEREGKNTDSKRGKRYGGKINDMYRRLGLDFAKINRVWVCWMVKDPRGPESALSEHFIRTGYSVEIMSFRDTILPALMDAVATSNYDDDALRTFSLIKEWKKQARKTEPGAPPNSRQPSPLPTPAEVRSSDSLRTPRTGGSG